jgi:hypothetical protein
MFFDIGIGSERDMLQLYIADSCSTKPKPLKLVLTKRTVNVTLPDHKMEWSALMLRSLGVAGSNLCGVTDDLRDFP